MKQFNPLPLFVLSALATTGCADAPRGPYQFRDYSDIYRVGGDDLGMVRYRPGKKSDRLQPPTLLYPLDRMVFGHFPRELVFRWEPAAGTPAGVEYLFEIDSVCGNDERFGDWSRQPEPMFAFRTAKTTLNDRFEGAQPGRWRAKVVDRGGESEWSGWRYFRFTQ